MKSRTQQTRERQWARIDTILFHHVGIYRTVECWHTIICREWFGCGIDYPTRAQVDYRLKKLENEGFVFREWHSRGWFKWYTYKVATRNVAEVLR